MLAFAVMRTVIGRLVEMEMEIWLRLICKLD